MLLKLDNPKFLADVIALLSELVLEVKAKINKEGFEITAIDPANVALVDLKIPASSFSEFTIENDEEIGLNLEDFKQVLRRASINDSLTLEKDNNTLKIKIEGRARRSFRLALINLDSEGKKSPSLNFTAKVEIDAPTFADVITDANIVADSCSLSAKENSFLIESKGTLHSADSEFNSDEVKINADHISKSKYSLDYLVKFVKAAKFSDKIGINFGNDYPGRFDFKNPNFNLSFVLAPRVEEE
ncbi:MAG: proliferating cell nuclear antigen (pcna) [archaeon]